VRKAVAGMIKDRTAWALFGITLVAVVACVFQSTGDFYWGLIVLLLMDYPSADSKGDGHDA